MSADLSDRLAAGLTRWTARVQQHSALVIAAFAVLVALSIGYAREHLQVDTRTSELIAPDLPWRKVEIAYAEAFPQNLRTIVAAVEAPTPEALDAAQRALADALAARRDVFADVRAPGTEDYFRRNAFLFLPTPQLEQLATDLEAAQPFLGHLARDPSLGGLAQLLGGIFVHAGPGLPVELDRVLTPLATTIEAAAQGRSQPLSWASLVAGRALPLGGPRFVIARPAAEIGEPDALRVAREVLAELQPRLPQGARVRLTGDIPLWMEELEAAFDGAIGSALAALALGAGFLYWGLRSLRLVLICLVALVGGLAITAGFAALTIGRLNMISVAFSTLYIGVAIDYGVQWCMRYRELIAGGAAPAAALLETGGRLGGALVLCALTTVAGFFAFIPTDYRGVAELGVIGGCGVIIGLVTSLTLLPAMVQRWAPRDAPRGPAGGTLLAGPIARLASLPRRHPRPVRVAAVVLALVSLALAPRLAFDYNPMHLKPADIPSLQLFEELSRGEHTPMNLSLLLPAGEPTAPLVQRLEALPTVRRVITLERLVPPRQDERLPIVEALAFSVGLTLPDSMSLAEPDAARDVPTLRELRDAARAWRGPPQAVAAAGTLAAALDAWLTRYVALPEADRADALRRLRDDLLGAMPGLLEQLSLALSATAVTVGDIPPVLRADWIAADGRQRVQIDPREDLNEDAALRRFVAEVQGVSDAAAGAPVGYVAGAEAVIGAFVQATLYASVLIVIFLLTMLRSFADTLRALAPLVLGSLLLCGLLVLTGTKLNFANVIALPLLLGIGVDIGVLILWRARHPAAAGEDNPLLTATGSAVLISVLATLGSFASLMLSVHRGMASIGLLLTAGLLIYLACTFLVLPALLPARRSSPPHGA